MNDNQPVIWKEYADLLALTARLAESADAYKHTIDLGLVNSDVWNKYSTILQKLGRKDEAQKAKEHAMNTYAPISVDTSDDSVPVCSVGALV
jgi:hypothetical protein